MHFNGNSNLKISNVMTADNCQNIMAALQYVAENSKDLSAQGVCQVKAYIAEQVALWSEQSNKKLTPQDIMYGLIRSHIILHGEGQDIHPVDVRYAVEHPMRISLMRYGVRLGDENAVRRVTVLTDMLFDNNGNPVYETQRLFLNALADKLIQDEQMDNQAASAMVKVLLDGMKRSAKGADSWSMFSHNMKSDAVCCIGMEQIKGPQFVASNRSNADINTLKRERN